MTLMTDLYEPLTGDVRRPAVEDLEEVFWVADLQKIGGQNYMFLMILHVVHVV